MDLDSEVPRQSYSSCVDCQCFIFTFNEGAVPYYDEKNCESTSESLQQSIDVSSAITPSANDETSAVEIPEKSPIDKVQTQRTTTTLSSQN